MLKAHRGTWLIIWHALFILVPMDWMNDVLIVLRKMPVCKVYSSIFQIVLAMTCTVWSWVSASGKKGFHLLRAKSSFPSANGFHKSLHDFVWYYWDPAFVNCKDGYPPVRPTEKLHCTIFCVFAMAVYWNSTELANNGLPFWMRSVSILKSLWKEPFVQWSR